MFKNELINGFHETRYIASWLRAGGQLYYGKDIDKFEDWLLSLGLTGDEVAHISNFGRVR